MGWVSRDSKQAPTSARWCSSRCVLLGYPCRGSDFAQNPLVWDGADSMSAIWFSSLWE